MSTAKALALAMAQGQRVYTLTSTNASQLNNITIDDGARAEIQSALSQGLEVTVHQSPIGVNGWTGSGYSIIDPEYGVGAYKISGGASGGFLIGLSFGLLQGIAVIAASLSVGAIAGAAALIAGVIFALTSSGDVQINFNGGRLVGLIAGLLLSVIVGQYVVIALTPLFLIGSLLLALNLLRLMAIEFISHAN